MKVATYPNLFRDLIYIIHTHPTCFFVLVPHAHFCLAYSSLFKENCATFFFSLCFTATYPTLHQLISFTLTQLQDLFFLFYLAYSSSCKYNYTIFFLRCFIRIQKMTKQECKGSGLQYSYFHMNTKYEEGMQKNWTILLLCFIYTFLQRGSSSRPKNK